MDSVTITLSSPGVQFNRWEVLRIASTAQKSVIIRIDKGNKNNITTTCYPYEDVEWGKFGRWIWFQLLKLETFLRLI